MTMDYAPIRRESEGALLYYILIQGSQSAIQSIARTDANVNEPPSLIRFGIGSINYYLTSKAFRTQCQ